MSGPVGDCPSCKGSGWYRCPYVGCHLGEVKHNCPTCDDEHACICPICVGEGWPPGRVPCFRCEMIGYKRAPKRARKNK